MSGDGEGRPAAAPRSRRLLPAWVAGYRSGWLRADSAAGLTLAVMLVPQAMAYAALAGLEPITGLYAATVALVAYAALGTSSHLSFGPVALVALLTAAAIDPLAQGDPVRFAALAGVLALMVGAIQLLLAAARIGAVVELISHPVVVGFTAAAGVIIALTQVRDLLGVDAPRSERFLEAARVAVAAVPDAHLPTVVVAAASLVLLLIGRRLVPRWPTSLVVSVLAIVAAVVFGLADRGVDVIGAVPSGLPRPSLPTVVWDDVRALLPAAAVIALIGYAESISIAKAIAARSRERIDANRELVASGIANAAAGVVSGFPVAGSFTRSAVAHEARAKTQLAGVVAAALLVAVLVLLTGLIEPLPKAVLAAIVVVAVVGLVDVGAARRILRIDRADGGVLIVTFVATLGLGVEAGLLVGVITNLAVHVRRRMRPALIELGRVVGTRMYRNVDRYPTVTEPSGALLRLDGALDFLSVEQVVTRLRRLAADRPELSWIVLDASGVTGMDSTGVHALQELQSHLAEAGVELHLATLRGRQRDLIARAGLWSELVEGSCHPDVLSALEALGLPSDSPLRRLGPDEEPPERLL